MEAWVETKISVLLANDFPIIRMSMSNLLNSSPNLEVVACATTKEEMITLIGVHRPNVSVLGLRLEWNALSDLVTKLSTSQTAVLVMTEAEDEKIIDLISLGANGIFSLRSNPDLLCKSVAAVAAGEIWVSRLVTARLIHHLKAQSAQITNRAQRPASMLRPIAKTLYGLTRREVDIVRAITDGMSNKDTSVELGISEYTVKHHLTTIFGKVGVHSRVELAMIATHLGLMDAQVGVVG
jgi:DNA-binding NarL/FixJ family response regulator